MGSASRQSGSPQAQQPRSKTAAAIRHTPAPVTRLQSLISSSRAFSWRFPSHRVVAVTPGGSLRRAARASSIFP